MNAQMVLAIAYLLTTALKSGLTLKEIMDRADENGMIDDDLRAKILADIKSAEAIWTAKRQG